MRSDESYLEDIYDAAEDAQEFVGGLQFDTFAQDRLLQRAVINCLHEIGEASNRLSGEFKAQHPAIPWRELVSRRNVLAHEYFRIDVAEVWHVIQTVLPKLTEYLKPLLPPNPDF